VADTLKLATRIITEHATAIRIMLDTLASFDEDTGPPESVARNYRELLDSMASSEEELARTLTEEGREDLSRLAMDHLHALREPALRLFPKIGVNDFCEQGRAGLRAFWDRTDVGATVDTRFSYAIGFIVCHRKCCANDAGNGVAAGVGCWDCGRQIVSEGCPPTP